MDNSGLHTRIEEIETMHKKDSLLVLTGNPQETMDSFGLDDARYAKGFSTLDELFERATAMPLFRRKLFEKETIGEKEGRAREKEPMYSKFVTEWLPQKTKSFPHIASTERLNHVDHQAQVLAMAEPSTIPITHDTGDEPTKEDDEGNPRIEERMDVLNKAPMRFNST